MAHNVQVTMSVPSVARQKPHRPLQHLRLTGVRFRVGGEIIHGCTSEQTKVEFDGSELYECAQNVTKHLVRPKPCTKELTTLILDKVRHSESYPECF